MKIAAPLILSLATALAPVAAAADQRHYAHRHAPQPQYHQQYQQPAHGYRGQGYRQHQPRRDAQAERQARNAKLLGGLVVLGIVLNAYNNKRD